ncbi:hypothetical protein U1Q18_044794 [Sarracenia purpurea var. burkii]
MKALPLFTYSVSIPVTRDGPTDVSSFKRENLVKQRPSTIASFRLAKKLNIPIRDEQADTGVAMGSLRLVNPSGRHVSEGKSHHLWRIVHLDAHHIFLPSSRNCSQPEFSRARF